jgi:hypothetical protein
MFLFVVNVNLVVVNLHLTVVVYRKNRKLLRMLTMKLVEGERKVKQQNKNVATLQLRGNVKSNKLCRKEWLKLKFA